MGGFGSKLSTEVVAFFFVHSHLSSGQLFCTSTMVWPLFVCYFLYVFCLPCPFLSTGTAVWPLLQFSSCNVLLCICMLHVHFCWQAQGFGHFFNFTPFFYNLAIFDPWASQTAAPVDKSGWSTNLPKTMSLWHFRSKKLDCLTRNRYFCSFARPFWSR